MNTLLGVTLAAQLVLFLFSGVSLLAPQHRVWPPPSRRSWQLVSTWFLSWVSLSGVFLLAIFGGNTLDLPIWFRIVPGVVLFGLGVSLIAWAFREHSVETTRVCWHWIRRGRYHASDGGHAPFRSIGVATTTTSSDRSCCARTPRKSEREPEHGESKRQRGA